MCCFGLVANDHQYVVSGEILKRIQKELCTLSACINEGDFIIKSSKPFRRRLYISNDKLWRIKAKCCYTMMLLIGMWTSLMV